MTTFDERLAAAPCGASVGPGWRPLIEELDKVLTRVAPEHRIAQVKEKFGGLRYYVDNLDGTNAAQVYAAIELAERLSYRICEDCGAPGTSVSLSGWFRTLCSGCTETAEERRAELMQAWLRQEGRE